ncbi:MAG: TonB-dependent receptor [Acidobacteria bacterium]|nr:TonB-dependent receptor [Acidobacteriota bacterium]
MKGAGTVDSRFASLVFLIAIVISYSASLSARQSGISIQGIVRDRAGAAVAGANVVVTAEGGGTRRTVRTDGQGHFELSGLVSGKYFVEISRAGFIAQTHREIAVGGETLTLDFVLEKASGENQSSRVSEMQLVGLPLNGRSYDQLATLQAGVADTSAQDSSRGVGGGSLTVAGSRPTSNNFLLDGTNIMDSANLVPRSASGVQLGSETVLQVQVFSGAYGAEYGRGSGGTLNSITRSGTNNLHGTLFEYFRNSKLDARNFFDPGDPPPFKRNQFGFILTGPVRKDRTFFLGAVELMRDRLTSTETTFLPDANAHNGIITDADGDVRVIGVDPRVRPYLNLMPIPNQGSIGSGFGRNTAAVFLPTNDYYFAIRVDHKLTDHDSFFARYTFDDATSITPENLYLFRSITNTRQQYVTLVASHIFNLHTINSIRLGYTRPVELVDSLEFIPQKLYFVPGAAHFGQINIPGMTPFGPEYTNPDGKKHNSFQFADDLVLQRGSHTLKIGGELHRYRWDIFNSNSKGGVWSFNSLESFLQGGPESTELIVALPGSDNHKGWRQLLGGVYVQDGYRVNRKLRLDLGLRYEAASIIQEKDGLIWFLPDWEHDTAMQHGPMLKRNPSLLNFSPRIGLSWSPGDSLKNMLVSGGFGIYYDPMLEHMVDTQKNSAPYNQRFIMPNFDASNVFPDAVAATALAPAGSQAAGVAVLDYNHMASPAVLRYNIGVQQTQREWSLRVYYVGARGNHLFRGYEANLYPYPTEMPGGALYFPPDSGPHNPAFGSITVTGADAQSFYNALQITANMNPKSGFSAQGNYTFSKSVDDASIPNGTTSTVITREYPLRRTSDRGLSEFDIRHRLSANYFYTLPFGPSQRWAKAGALAQIFGGFRLGSVISYRTGTPFHALINVRSPRYLFTANRPNLNPNSKQRTSGTSAGCAGAKPGETLGGPDRFFDPCVYSVPVAGYLGNVGRNTLIGPSVFTMDLSLQKHMVLGGERRLEFRAEFFNLPNHPNFALPLKGSSIVFSGASGRPNPTTGQLVRTITTSRQIQFALRFSF